MATLGTHLWTPTRGRSTLTSAARTAATELSHSEDRVLTLDQWLDRWLGRCETRGLRPSTIDSYRTILRLHVGESLRTAAMTAVTPDDLNLLYRRLLASGRRNGNGGLSARTVRYLHTILNRALADAVRAGCLPSNPAALADPPSARAARARVYPVWSPEELSRFLTVAKNDTFYLVFHLAAATGLRRGELLGLRWVDVDAEAKVLHVVQTVIEVGHEPRIMPPKTDTSRRLVALDARTADLFAGRRAGFPRRRVEWRRRLP